MANKKRKRKGADNELNPDHWELEGQGVVDALMAEQPELVQAIRQQLSRGLEEQLVSLRLQMQAEKAIFGEDSRRLDGLAESAREAWRRYQWFQNAGDEAIDEVLSEIEYEKKSAA